MRLIDRYIIKEFLGPFLFGLGAFSVVMIGMYVAPFVLRLFVSQQYPASLAARIFLLHLPQVVNFALPMAALFGSLMAIAAMSSHGEIVAIRAGGGSLERLSAPILIMGALLAALNFVAAESIVPACMDTMHRLRMNYLREGKAVENLLFSIPPVRPQRIVYAKSYHPEKKELEGLAIIELRHGEPWETLKAQRAVWQGRTWLLHNVELKMQDPQGRQTILRLDLRTHDLGKTPEELVRGQKLPDNMSLAELKQEIAKLRRLSVADRSYEAKLTQYIYMHWALPFVPFFFAWMGIPLGLRPVRASTGLGLGVSLAIALGYYMIFYTFHLIGQQGAIPHLVAAWLPNVVLFAAALALFINARR